MGLLSESLRSFGEAALRLADLFAAYVGEPVRTVQQRPFHFPELALPATQSARCTLLEAGVQSHFVAAYADVVDQAVTDLRSCLETAYTRVIADLSGIPDSPLGATNTEHAEACAEGLSRYFTDTYTGVLRSAIEQALRHQCRPKDDGRRASIGPHRSRSRREGLRFHQEDTLWRIFDHADSLDLAQSAYASRRLQLTSGQVTRWFAKARNVNRRDRERVPRRKIDHRLLKSIVESSDSESSSSEYDAETPVKPWSPSPASFALPPPLPVASPSFVPPAQPLPAPLPATKPAPQPTSTLGAFRRITPDLVIKFRRGIEQVFRRFAYGERPPTKTRRSKNLGRDPPELWTDEGLEAPHSGIQPATVEDMAKWEAFEFVPRKRNEPPKGVRWSEQLSAVKIFDRDAAIDEWEDEDEEMVDANEAGPSSPSPSVDEQPAPSSPCPVPMPLVAGEDTTMEDATAEDASHAEPPKSQRPELGRRIPSLLPFIRQENRRRQGRTIPFHLRPKRPRSSLRFEVVVPEPVPQLEAFAFEAPTPIHISFRARSVDDWRPTSTASRGNVRKAFLEGDLYASIQVSESQKTPPSAWSSPSVSVAPPGPPVRPLPPRPTFAVKRPAEAYSAPYRRLTMGATDGSKARRLF